MPNKQMHRTADAAGDPHVGHKAYCEIFLRGRMAMIKFKEMRKGTKLIVIGIALFFLSFIPRMFGGDDLTKSIYAMISGFIAFIGVIMAIVGRFMTR